MTGGPTHGPGLGTGASEAGPGPALVIKPLGSGWERVDRRSRLPRWLALFWPLPTACAWLALFLGLAQPVLAAAGGALLAGGTALTSHARLLARVELRDGRLSRRRALGWSTRFRVSRLERVVTVQLANPDQSSFRAPRLYFLDRDGHPLLRLRVSRYRQEDVERLLAALAVPVERSSPVLGVVFSAQHPQALRTYRALNQDPVKWALPGCLVLGLAVGGLVVLLILSSLH